MKIICSSFARFLSSVFFINENEQIMELNDKIVRKRYYKFNDCNVVIQKCVFIACMAKSTIEPFSCGGALTLLFQDNSGKCLIEYCGFMECFAPYQGGALYIKNTIVSCKMCEYINCSSFIASSIYICKGEKNSNFTFLSSISCVSEKAAGSFFEGDMLDSNNNNFSHIYGESDGATYCVERVTSFNIHHCLYSSVESSGLFRFFGFAETSLYSNSLVLNCTSTKGSLVSTFSMTTMQMIEIYVDTFSGLFFQRSSPSFVNCMNCYVSPDSEKNIWPYYQYSKSGFTTERIISAFRPQPVSIEQVWVTKGIPHPKRHAFYQTEKFTPSAMFMMNPAISHEQHFVHNGMRWDDYHKAVGKGSLLIIITPILEEIRRT